MTMRSRFRNGVSQNSSIGEWPAPDKQSATRGLGTECQVPLHLLAERLKFWRFRHTRAAAGSHCWWRSHAMD